jgi:hypothetical protein
MSPTNRDNPDATDADGLFGWDVIAGYYIVRAEAEDCVSPDDSSQSFVETDVLTIPPPVTDLILVLECAPPSSDTDTTPPLCEVQGVDIAHPAPPSNVLVHVQDLGSGLSHVNVLTQDNIGDVTFDPAITPGTTELIEIVADKASEGSQARFAIEVFDVAGNRSKCDPVLVVLNRSPSSPRYSTYDAIPQADRFFTISNTGESIITYAMVNVNNRWFLMPTLLPYEVKTIDIGSALVSGEKNTVTVWGGGHRSQVMISDVIPARTNTFAYPVDLLY